MLKLILFKVQGEQYLDITNIFWFRKFQKLYFQGMHVVWVGA